MGDFTAKLELPRFIPKEQILGKYVFDSEVVCIGLVEDWTYSSDGEIKMVVKMKDGVNKNSPVLIPFSQIDKVGQFILLKMRREKFKENIKQQEGSEGEKEKKNEWLKNDELKYFDKIDEKKLNQLIKKETKTS